MQTYAGLAWFPMQTRNLETLLWVVRLGSVSAAARHLNVTQPTVSRRIDELERELGTTLFRREGRKVVATSEARLCLPIAERILGEATALQGVASGRGPARRRVRIGVAELVALTWFDRLLTRIGETHPHVDIDMHVNLASSLVDGLSRRALDMALIPGQVPIAGVVRLDLGVCDYRWMARRDMLDGRDWLAPQDMTEMPIFMSPQGSDTHQAIMRWFQQAGVAPSRVSLCNNLGVLASLVRKGRGIASLPVELFAEDLSSGSLIALPGRPALPPVQYSACYLPSAEAVLLNEIAGYAREASWFARD